MTDDRSMQRALAAGLPAEHLAVLMAARRHWRAQNESAPTAEPDDLTESAAGVLWSTSLAAALAHPAAESYDEVFVAAARRDHPRG